MWVTIGPLGDEFCRWVLAAAPIHGRRVVDTQPLLADRSLPEYAFAARVLVEVLKHVPAVRRVGRCRVEVLYRPLEVTLRDLADAEALELFDREEPTRPQPQRGGSMIRVWL
jgi:hypothetical protein